MARILSKVEPPALPLAPDEFNRPYQDQLNNVHRLFYNRLTNILGALIGGNGGQYIEFPNGSFFQDGATTLTAPMTNTSTTPIAVVSTSAFPSAGSLLIGDEIVAFTGKTPTTFTGITRGVYGSTNVSHAIGQNVTEALGVASLTTARSIPFTGITASNLVTLNTLNPARVEFGITGRYNIQFSAQLLNVDSTDDIVTFWFKLNGSDIPYRAGVSAIAKKTGAGPGLLIVTWNLVLDILEGSYVELYFASRTGNTVVATFPAGTAPVTPVSPSVILTATFVSGLP